MASNILILNFTRMGDLIQSTPLIAGLRKNHPHAHLTLVVGSEFSEFAERLPYIDEILTFDLKQFNERDSSTEVSWVEVYRYFERFLDSLVKRKFELVFNLSHSKLSALMIKYLGIPDFRGFMVNPEGDRITQHPWLQYFFTEPFNRPYNSFNLADIFALGGEVHPKDTCLELNTPEKDIQTADSLMVDFHPQASLTLSIQAGSSIKGRRWPTERFAQLADLLIEKLDARIFLLGVSKEHEDSQSIIESMQNIDRVRNLCGKTNIPQLMGVLQQSHYLITNDTGTMHLAAAMGIKIVGLFFAHAHPFETAPYAEGNIIFKADIPCAPCSYGVECNDIVCVRQVSPQQVFTAIEGKEKDGAWRFDLSMSHIHSSLAFETEFDRDGFLRMKPLVRMPVTLTRLMQSLYRRVWKKNLISEVHWNDTLEKEVLWQELQSDFDWIDWNASVEPILITNDRLIRILELADQGMDTSGEMIRLIQKRGAYQDILQSSVKRISEIDESINILGLTHPELKPLTDMFNKRKENLYGEDVLQLTQGTDGCYRALKREGKTLWDLLQFVRKKNEEPVPQSQAFVNSSNVAVPGR